jgi:hypothetical protein
MKILFQGDSITDAGRYTEVGTGVRDSSLGAGYVKLIANRLLCDSPEKNYEIINRGISGNRIVDLYARWKADCINLAPDVLTILIGVNDTWHERGGQNGVEVPRYERFYRELIEWTLSALPNIKIILMTPFANPVNDHIASFFPEVIFSLSRLCSGSDPGIIGRVPTQRHTRLTAVSGSVTEKNSPAPRLKAEYKNRFCGLPTGVAILPRLAATVCITMTGMMFLSQPRPDKRSIVKGTKTRSATSLVTSIEAKNGNKTKVRPSTLPFFMRLRS